MSVEGQFYNHNSSVLGGDIILESAIYRTKVVKLGANSLDFLGEKMIIFFNKRVQDQLADYSILIDDAEGSCDIKVGNSLKLGDSSYKVTAIGEVAMKNLSNLGHVVVKFDGKDTADLPGNIHVENKNIAQIYAGLEISFVN